MTAPIILRELMMEKARAHGIDGPMRLGFVRQDLASISDEPVPSDWQVFDYVCAQCGKNPAEIWDVP